MKHIALFVMSILLKKAKREKIGKELIIQQAYDGMIDSYETTILFIKANIKGTYHKLSLKKVIQQLTGMK